MSDSDSAREATNAVIILEALAKVLQASPFGLTEEDTADHVGYVREAASAVARAADLDPEQLMAAKLYGGSKWTTALLNILFPRDQVMDVYARMARR